MRGRGTHSVEEHEVPVLGQAVPGDLVGLVAEGEDGLDGDVHEHHALGAQLEGQDLEGVGDEHAGEADVVEDAEEPDEDELGPAGGGVAQPRVLVEGAADGPAGEGDDHARDGDEEERPAPEAVYVERREDRHDEV